MDPVRETAGLTLRIIVRYVRARGGDQAVAKVLALAGATDDAEVYDDPRRWWSRDFKIRMFEAAETVFADDEVATKIGMSVLEHSLGTTLRLTLSLLAGPAQLLRLVSKANRKFNTCAEMTAVMVRPSGGVVSFRQRVGYRPDRHDCNYTRGLLTQIPAVFGLPPATVQHDVCEVLGHDECLYELRWRPLRRLTIFRPGRRRDDAFQLSGVIANQLRALQATVAEVVGAQNPQRVLSAITERAAFAVNAHA